MILMPSDARREEIDRQFRDFHSLNPHVYQELVALARKAKSHGANKIGIEYIFNIARWESMLKTKSDSDTFKLNNNFKSRYSRLIMENEIDLDGFFSTRNAG
jgi:hypothetical protein